MKTRFTALVAILVCLAVPLGTFAEELALTFGTYATDRPSEIVRKLRPLLNAIEEGMSRRLGQPVEIKTQISGDYEQGIADLTAGRVDFVRFGVTSYITAKAEEPEIHLLAIESNGGEKRFYGIICVNESSSVRTVRDLAGSRFAFGNELSTFGRYLSQQFLFENGIRARDLASYEYLGRHDKVGSAVASGLFDAGALKESTFDKLVAKGKPLRAIARIPIVTRPWVGRHDLPPEVLAALRETLLAIENPEALKAIRRSGFLPSTDADFESVRKAMLANSEFGSDDE